MDRTVKCVNLTGEPSLRALECLQSPGGGRDLHPEISASAPILRALDPQGPEGPSPQQRPAI